MVEAGIYRITIWRTGQTPRFYIGQSVNLADRKSRHLWELRNGFSKNPAMQTAFLYYGERNYYFDVLETCEPKPDVLAFLEKKHIDNFIGFCGRRSLFNVLIDKVKSRAGVPHSEETRTRMKLVAQQKPRSEKQKQSVRKMIELNRGRKLSPESVVKRTAKQKGLKRSAETRKRLSESQKRRYAR
jgi:group I intron endonuclease